MKKEQIEAEYSEILPADPMEVLSAIEKVAGDDWCAELEMDNALSRKLRGRIAVANQKLMQIYRLSHAFNTQHSCHHVHDNWREELNNFREPKIKP